MTWLDGRYCRDIDRAVQFGRLETIQKNFAVIAKVFHLFWRFLLSGIFSPPPKGSEVDCSAFVALPDCKKMQLSFAVSIAGLFFTI